MPDPNVLRSKKFYNLEGVYSHRLPKERFRILINNFRNVSEIPIVTTSYIFSYSDRLGKTFHSWIDHYASSLMKIIKFPISCESKWKRQGSISASFDLFDVKLGVQVEHEIAFSKLIFFLLLTHCWFCIVDELLWMFKRQAERDLIRWLLQDEWEARFCSTQPEFPAKV